MFDERLLKLNIFDIIELEKQNIVMKMSPSILKTEWVALGKIWGKKFSKKLFECRNKIILSSKLKVREILNYLKKKNRKLHIKN